MTTFTHCPHCNENFDPINSTAVTIEQGYTLRNYADLIPEDTTDEPIDGCDCDCCQMMCLCENGDFACTCPHIVAERVAEAEADRLYALQQAQPMIRRIQKRLLIKAIQFFAKAIFAMLRWRYGVNEMQIVVDKDELLLEFPQNDF